MKILVTGRGVSASWRIRGEQLGAAIGATVQPNAWQVSGFDCAIVVKRPRQEQLHRLHGAGVPIVWDVVDAWPQPHGNEWDKAQCMEWLRAAVADVRPAAIVAATKAMAADCAEFGIPVLALPHHSRPGQTVNPIREKVWMVGYQGGHQYLGNWLPMIDRECSRRGWLFVMNPAQLAEVDIVLALRSQQGYAARHWKSNVKVANAQGSGTPCIASYEHGYLETAGNEVIWVRSDDELADGFDHFTNPAYRRIAAERLLATDMSLPRIANDYRTWLEALKF